MFEKLFGKRSKVQQMAEEIDEESLKRLAALISESDILCSGAGATTITISPRGASMFNKSAGYPMMACS